MAVYEGVWELFVEMYEGDGVGTGRVRTGRDMYVYFHIPLYTFIYLHIPSDTPEYLYIPLYTPIYIKISNIQKIRSDIRPQNGHKSDPRASPMARIWHAPSYHTPKGFSMPKGTQF